MFSSQLQSEVVVKTDFKWDCGRFDFFSDDVTPEGRRRSPQFTTECGNRTWHLEAQVSKGPMYSAINVAVYLILESVFQDVVVVDFMIEMIGNRNRKRGKTSGTCRFEQDMQKEIRIMKSAFQSFIPENIKFILCLFSHVTRIELYNSFTNSSRVFRQDLRKLFESSVYSDVVLKVKDTEILAHRDILSARSPVFAAMFEHDMAEKQTGRVEIPDISPEAMRQFLVFVYSCDVSPWSHEVAKELLGAANKYRVLDLMSLCEKYLICQLDESNAVELLDFADDQCATELKEAAIHFICSHSNLFNDMSRMAALSNKSELLDEMKARISRRSVHH